MEARAPEAARAKLGEILLFLMRNLETLHKSDLSVTRLASQDHTLSYVQKRRRHSVSLLPVCLRFFSFNNRVWQTMENRKHVRK